MSEAAEESAPRPADFAAFFQEVHGYCPFPWQESLVRRVLDRGWPALIDVPTGLGKTAVLDVAVFLSALRSEHSRRRVFLVVDRRLIVDQAHEEAERIRQALADAQPGGVCARVRGRLAVPGDDTASVLDVTRMRGGANWSWLWIERPDRHAIVTGTVDQIGSRLLFRGYGVGKQLRPIDAAMVGRDSLIIIDEAHLSDPFFSTLTDALALDVGGVGRPPAVVAMSASPETESDAHGITDADVEHEVAGKRLKAAKSLHPVTVSATASAATSAVADGLTYWARQIGGHGKVVGVVANTVGMARSVFDRLRSQVADPSGCLLLTGRIRPIDREYLLHEWLPKIKSGAGRDPDAELYVVATQTIEAGADIDMDGMVTQSASLSALVQRLGRVNRLGERGSARAVVVHADKLADPVYGEAAVQTWAWLTSLTAQLAHKAGRSEENLGAGIDASPIALRELAEGIPGPNKDLMHGEKPYVPLVSRTTLNAWARTSPLPHPDVPVAPYLHGLDAGEPTVFVVWRADARGDDPESWKPSVSRIPPSPDEALELPVSALRRWLSKPSPEAQATAQSTDEPGTSDLESQKLDAWEEAGQQASSGRRRVLRYRGADEASTVSASEIRPGDFVIVPADWGGCDRYGWCPSSSSGVIDVADFTGWRGKRTAAIRIGSVLTDAVDTLAPELFDQVESFIAEVKDDIVNESTDDDAYRRLLADMIDGRDQQLPHERVFGRLALPRNRPELVLDEEDATAGIAGIFAASGASWNEDESAGGTSAATDRVPQTLAEHQAAVERRAREFARHLDLPDVLADAVAYAAEHHDEGKQDPRFQVMLHGGDHLKARIAQEPLAKSGMDPADRAALRRAASLSGYPEKMRHEALSMQITRAMLDQEPGAGLDRDLVVHLVAAHHGHARPLLPAIVDRDPRKVPVVVAEGQTVLFDTADTVDWTGPERFFQLCERYGRWGLALLESVVRLADIWCSARPDGHTGPHPEARND